MDKYFLYIGIYSPGTTSKMRADILRKILPNWEFDIIDTDVPKNKQNRLWQSIGFRYKIGPLISAVNDYVKAHVNKNHYNIIWVDKAIYLSKETTRLLRDHTKCLLHYSPDPAFKYHQSKLFYSSLPLYDYAVTTKLFELHDYARYLNKDQILYATQGFDKSFHLPIHDMNEKSGVCFIGHYEDDRERVIQKLIDSGIEVKLAGIKWEKFVKSNSNNQYLKYLGSGVYGEDYVKTISSCLISWGSVSKWIPEQHTTRTFEIPACGTALLTERNEELSSFFCEDEVIFYDNDEELISKVKYYLNKKTELEQIILKGRRRVISDGRDYESIIKTIINKITKYES